MTGLRESVEKLKQPITFAEMNEWAEDYIKQLEEHLRLNDDCKDDDRFHVGFKLARDIVLRFLRGETKEVA